MALRWCLIFSLLLGLLSPAPGHTVVAVAEDAPSEEPAAPQTPEESADDKDEPDPSGGVAAGHSYHGAAFNEGPRQAAYLMGGTGDVLFPATTDKPLAQKFIDQGVGQLHGFWYFEAERSFRQAAMIDPDCAIAYWGMAMANASNTKRAKGFINRAIGLKSKTTPRERMYIDALRAYIYETDRKKDTQKRKDLAAAYERIIKTHPDDVEAKAFLAVHQWSSRSKLKLKYEEIDAVIKQVLEANPLHPAHHYRIHLWDYKEAAEALPNAALCGASSPGIAHMWHMPGHIYSRLKRYEDAAWQQEASARADHAHMMRDRVMPDQIHNYAHNNEWLCRNLVNVGRARDAIELAKNMIELPRHPKYNTPRKGSANYGRRRLFEALHTFEMWDELLALTDSAYLEPTDDEDDQLRRRRARGVALASTGRATDALPIITQIDNELTERKAKRDQAVADAEMKAKEENKNEEDTKKATENAAKPFEKRINELESAANELRGLVLLSDGVHDKAIELLSKTKDIAKPRLAMYHLRAGQADEAEKLAREHVKGNDKEAQPLAVLAHVLFETGKTQDAQKTFNELRDLSSGIDLSSPVFARLAPIAKSLDLPDDWRKPREIPEDFGDRPELASLGPFRWQPTQAPSWKLPDADGHAVSLSDYQGKPVIVIFYLGYGCVHCTEQLAAFHPLTADFRKLGIDLVGVSTDNVEDLKKALAPAKAEGGFPFPLLSDAKLDVFKQYRAYDDFERFALHGTFLIDADGYVRWQDISYEPFMDAKFLLAEAPRLLAMKPAPVAKASAKP